MRIAAPATLRNMLFVYNTAVGGGAGVLAAPGLTVEDSTFSSNVDAVGGAGLLVFGSALITGCSFSDNLVLDTAGPLYRGGAGLLAIDAELTVDRCQFQRNTVEGAFAGGGGVAMEGSGTAAVIRHSRFSNNSVHDSGGALTVRDGATAAVVNSAFWNNQSSSSAGGILALGGSTRVSLVNCTLMNNEAALEEGAGLAVEQGANASLVNSIVWGNTGATGSADQAAQVWSDSTAPYATHSCIQGGEWSPGVANISQDPQVADAIGGDLRLQAGSPCIDAANTLVDVDPFAAGFTALAPSDLGGRFRVTDGDGDGQEQVDMGAYEFQSAP